jgi:hypothetical protein
MPIGVGELVMAEGGVRREGKGRIEQKWTGIDQVEWWR